ncbi:FRG domain-containing protein [Sinorhizobium meliloti]|uniref:FRG domain-containing protein n=1 Tax=Rhizobium meliloti TaxID=382 RepID=UPI00142F5FCD
MRRRVPNPRRADKSGREIAIMPGVYRQSGEFYSLSVKHEEQRSFKLFASQFEPNRRHDPHFSYDLMRTEQHYATQTAGLDLAFDIRSALFFATHQFQWDDQGKATYRAIPRGEHLGVIYLFRFGSPPVRRTDFLVQDFDFFRTRRPERILRQQCGLPLFDSYERNIALTEVDCIIELDAEFESADGLTPEYMFPNTSEDSFYSKLLELKDAHPTLLSNVVEYRWARE